MQHWLDWISLQVDARKNYLEQHPLKAGHAHEHDHKHHHHGTDHDHGEDRV